MTFSGVRRGIYEVYWNAMMFIFNNFNLTIIIQLLFNIDNPKMMLEENRRVRGKIPAAFEALMGLHLAKVDDVIEPGLTMLTWTSVKIPDFIQDVYR